MTKNKLIKDTIKSLSEFETINFSNINRDTRIFFKFSNEKVVLVREIISIMKPKKTYSVLEIGCGEGHVIKKIYRKVKKCIALDPDPKMLDILRQKIGKVSNVVLITKTFEDYKTEEKFDIILTSHTLSFFDDKWKAVEKMLNYTKEGGKIIIVLHSNSSEQIKILREIFHKVYRKTIKHIYAEALYDRLVAYGLEPKLKKIETISKLPSIDTACEMSYFLFRIDYQKARDDVKNLIRTYLEKRRKNKYVEISTTHGIIILCKNHFTT